MERGRENKVSKTEVTIFWYPNFRKNILSLLLEMRLLSTPLKPENYPGGDVLEVGYGGHFRGCFPPSELLAML